MPAYSHLLDEERDQIAVMRAAGCSICAIARVLQRATSTISRELRRNALPSGGYSPLHADGAYRLRRRREDDSHQDLMRSVARRIVDRQVLRLIKLWLKAPVEESNDAGKRRLTGGKRSTCGTPQGGVISPLLANLYMNRFLKHWRASGRGEAYQARIVAYADDFVILSRSSAAEA